MLDICTAFGWSQALAKENAGTTRGALVAFDNAGKTLAFLAASIGKRIHMNISTTNRAVMTAMHRILESLCGGDWSAVRVACVPNGIDYRFIACIGERWRPEVYEYLAARTDILIPADGGPLNLSIEQAVALGKMNLTSKSTEAERTSNRRRTETGARAPVA